MSRVLTLPRWLGVTLLIGPAYCGLSEALILGTPPDAPANVEGLPRLDYHLRELSTELRVDTFSREQVRNFYNAVFVASENVPMDSTADQASCYPGTNSAAFIEATRLRVNWYRAMAGVPANITFLPEFTSNAQQAALIMSANNSLSHYPPSDWVCWTPDGYDAAQHSNLGLGANGPEVVSRYVADLGANNYSVGHRRWLLYPQTRLMGTGDMPEAGAYSAANALWVIDGHYSDPRPPTRTPYVAWPPAGYVPYQVVFPRWSVSYPGANFSAATVSMLSNGVPVSVVLEPVKTGYGENTLVWVMSPLDPNDPRTRFPFDGSDTVYQVAISNIAGAPFSYVVYTVTVFDPAVPGPDHIPLVLTGPDRPYIGETNVYTFPAVTNAGVYMWRAAFTPGTNVADGAEAGLVNFTNKTSPGYAVVQSSVKASGMYAFHLAHPEPTDQLLVLSYPLLPQTNTVLNFKSRLGWATPDQVAKVQVSSDTGATWRDVYSQPGTGTSGETTFSTRTVPLGVFSEQPIMLRFNYSFAYGFYYPQTDPGVGWYIDDVVISNARGWLVASTGTVTTTSFVYVPTTAAEVALQVCGLLFDCFLIEWGPIKFVNPVPRPAQIVLDPPRLLADQVWIEFRVFSGAATAFELLEAPTLAGTWTTNTNAVLALNAGVFRFIAPRPNDAIKFYRVRAKVEECFSVTNP